MLIRMLTFLIYQDKFVVSLGSLIHSNKPKFCATFFHIFLLDFRL
jgi:hypothetical protein